MGVLKGIGYIIAAALVISVVSALGTLVAGLVIIGGLLFYGALVVAFVAYCIKEYCEAEPGRSETSEHERGRKES